MSTVSLYQEFEIHKSVRGSLFIEFNIIINIYLTFKHIRAKKRSILANSRGKCKKVPLFLLSSPKYATRLHSLISGSIYAVISNVGSSDLVFSDMIC